MNFDSVKKMSHTKKKKKQIISLKCSSKHAKDFIFDNNSFSSRTISAFASNIS